MFSERDRRCTAWQHMLSTDSSYDNRTIASTLKMQIWMVQRLRAQLNESDDPLPPYFFEVGLKVNTKVYLDVLKSGVIPWCNQVAHKSKETQAWLQKKRYDFVPFFHWPPPPPTWIRWVYFIWSCVENITNRTSHIAAILRVFAELPPALVEKVCSQFWIRIEVVIEAATLNRCNLYYIIKYPEYIFSIKVFLNEAVVLFSLGRNFYHFTRYIYIYI